MGTIWPRQVVQTVVIVLGIASLQFITACAATAPAAVAATAKRVYTESIANQWRDPNPAWTFCRRGQSWVALTTEKSGGHWFRLAPDGSGYRLEAWGARDPTFPKLDMGGERLCDE